MTYDEYVSQLKVKARDIFRCKAVARFKEKLFTLSQAIANDAKDVTLAEKDLAIAEYDLSKIDAEHPNAAKMTKKAEKKVENRKEDLKDLNKQIEDTDNAKAVTELNEKIAKIESGETRIGIDKINAKVHEWLDGIEADDYPDEDFDGSDKEPKETDDDDDDDNDDDGEDSDDYTPEDID